MACISNICNESVCWISRFADNTEDYDSEGSESDEDNEYNVANGLYDDDEEEDEDLLDDSDEDEFVQRSSVIIEEVNDDEHGLAQVTAAKVCLQNRPCVHFVDNLPS